MAKELIIQLRDDLDGSDATRTVVFAWEGVPYEIDLSDDNAEKFSAAIAPYVGAARRSSTRPPARARIVASIVEAYDDAQAALAKTGAAPRGTPTPKKASPKRGRVAASIVEAYDDAQAALAKTGAAPRGKPTPRKASPRRARVAASIVEAYDDAQAALAKTGAAPRKAPVKKA